MKTNRPFSNFGCDVFNDAAMRDGLSPTIYEALRQTVEKGTELTFEVATAVAAAMKEWALKKGATHYTHWFQPMTGSTAEKRDAFLVRQGEDALPILEFSGKALIRGEADGSSFPSGGLRATFEARGYTTWDCTSPAFVKRDSDDSCTLCIPTAFCAFSGEALDEKTPLLRSMEAVSRQAVRVLHSLGETNVHRVIPTVGGEQEYFLVDRSHFLKRKDLVYTGRTLFGAPPAKGQEMADQYYAATPERIAGFMHELDETLWRMGVPAKTQHNESAPSQYELAPIFASANIAADHNQIIMEQMRRIADRHDLKCLVHEKPFKNVNGSGKHTNWSLRTDTGKNLLKPGKDADANRIFLTFFVAVIAAVDEYANALRMSCATLGNAHRLGGNEAPPQIISIYTGQNMHQELLQFAVDGVTSPHTREHMCMGVSTLAVLHKDEADRNRTSPFAFTGDKFEFRMPGASQSLGLPATTINTIVAEMLSRIADQLEQAEDTEHVWKEIVSALIGKHERVLFNGNNYTKEWVEEAKRRGLPNVTSTVDAIALMGDPIVQDVFARHGVFSNEELFARRDVACWAFSQLAHIEASAMLKISRQKLLPACIRYAGEVARAYNAVVQAGAPAAAQKRVLNALCALIERFEENIETLSAKLAQALQASSDENSYARAKAMLEIMIPAMDELRASGDALERVVDKEYWPLPSYGEMLYHII